MRLALSVLLLFLLYTLKAQDSTGKILTGLVTDYEENRLSDVSIVAYDSLDRIVVYETTDLEGKYSILLTDQVVYLDFNHLSFETKKVLTDTINVWKAYRVSLTPKTYKLDSLQVRADRVFIKVVDDTVSYDISGYYKIGDTRLSDILQRMEGISIDKSGTIMYHGKRIDKLLLNGMDILNDQHKMTADGIKAEDINEIEIIENYRDFRKRLSFINPEMVAMNIHLKDSMKGSYSFSADALGGVQNKYKVDYSGYQANRSRGHTEFFRSNNVGIDNIAPLDFVTLKSDLLDALNASNGDFESLLPRFLGDQRGTFKKINNTISTVWEAEDRNQASHNISIFMNAAESESELQSQRIYQFDDLRIKGTESESREPFYGLIRYIYQGSKGMLKEFEIDATGSMELFNQQSTNSFIPLLESSTSHLDQAKYDASLRATKAGIIGSNWNYSIDFLGSKDVNRPTSINLSTEAIQIDLPKMVSNEVLLNRRKFISIGELQYKRDKWVHSLSAFSKWDNRSSSSSFLDLNNTANDLVKKEENTVIRYNNNAEYSARFRSKKTNIKLTVGANRITQKSRQNGKTVNYLYSTRMRWKWSFSSNESLSLSLSSKSDLPSQDYFRNVETINFPNSIQWYNLAELRKQEAQGIDIFYQYKNPLKKIMFFSSGNVSRVFNPVSFRYELSDNTVVESLGYAKRSTDVKFKTGLFASVSQRIRIRSSLQYSLSKFVDEQPSRNRHIGVDQSITLSHGNGFINSINTKINTSKVKLSSSTNKSIDFLVSYSLKYQYKKVKLQPILKYLSNFNNGEGRKWWSIDLDMSYNFDANWSIKMSGVRLNNLKGQLISSADLGVFSSEFYSYREFPGYLIIGVSYRN